MMGWIDRVEIGAEVLAAREARPTVPWKVLQRRFGLSRTRLWQLGREAAECRRAADLDAVAVAAVVRRLRRELVVVERWLQANAGDGAGGYLPINLLPYARPLKRLARSSV